MDEEYYKQLYRDITKKFYQQFDRFITFRWCGRTDADVEKLTDADRKAAYKNFYHRVKRAGIANRQTIRRWFGLEGECSIPSRSQIIKAALAAGLSVEETTEYLQYGISQQGFQENDYREFIAKYCLAHALGPDIYRRMVSFYEQKIQNRGEWEQESHTNWLREQYEEVKDYSKEDFLVWMHKHQRYFKGYSLTVLQCYRELIQQCLIFFRKDVQEALARELKENGYYEWQTPRDNEGTDNVHEIERFVKNKLRLRNTPMTAEAAKEIRKLMAIAYAPQDRMSDLVSELYSTMPGRKRLRREYGVYDALGREIKRVDQKYVSELLNMAVLKEKELRLRKELASETDETARAQKEKELKKFHQRVHLIGRSDLLVLVQYIVYRRVEEYGIVYDKSYSQKDAQEEFRKCADGILEMCGMRRIDENYMLDHVMMACFGEEEMYLFSEAVEGVE